MKESEPYRRITRYDDGSTTEEIITPGKLLRRVIRRDKNGVEIIRQRL